MVLGFGAGFVALNVMAGAYFIVVPASDCPSYEVKMIVETAIITGTIVTLTGWTFGFINMRKKRKLGRKWKLLCGKNSIKLGYSF